MSIIHLPDWMPRPRRREEEVEAQLKRGAFKIPEDMMRKLDEALIDERRQPPLGTPAPRVRTAQVIATELEHLREDLADARAVVKKGEEKEAALAVELAKTIDEEVAAKKATHEAELAELESLRASTGETA